MFGDENVASFGKSKMKRFKTGSFSLYRDGPKTAFVGEHLSNNNTKKRLLDPFFGSRSSSVRVLVKINEKRYGRDGRYQGAVPLGAALDELWSWEIAPKTAILTKNA